jgi:hypothetical protein
MKIITYVVHGLETVAGVGGSFDSCPHFGQRRRQRF